MIYCSLAFGAISIAGDGNIKPCCNLDLNSFYKLDCKGGKNSPAMIDIRQKLIDNVWPETCKNCKYVESFGNNSMRTIYNDKFKDINIPLNSIVDSKNIIYIDIFLGNKCNSKCMTCGPASSDYWQEEFNFIHNSSTNISNQKVLNFDDCKNLINEYPNTLHISFIGGEPTVITSHLQFLQYLVDIDKSKNISLTYNTNLTGFTTEILNLWRQFKNVGVSVSIDGYEKINEYIRYPFKWNKIDNNLNMLLELDNVGVSLACTLSVFNAIDVPNLFEYWYNKLFDKVKNEIPMTIPAYINRVKYPNYMDVNLLSTDYRSKSLEKCDLLMNRIIKDQRHGSIIDALNIYMNYMKEPQVVNQKYIDKLTHFIKKSDEFRKRSINDYIPDLSKELNL